MRNIFGKELLMGIGVGCIISAMIISLFGGLVITDEEVIARASKLGMVRQLLRNDDQKAQGVKVRDQSETQGQKVAGSTLSSKQSPNSNKSAGQEASKASSLNNNKKNEVPDNKENVVKNNAQMSKL